MISDLPCRGTAMKRWEWIMTGELHVEKTGNAKAFPVLGCVGGRWRPDDLRCKSFVEPESENY